MKIALLTTWGNKCGIAEYSRDLVEAFPKEVEFKILGQYFPDNHQTLYPETPNVLRCWHNYWLTHQMGADMPAMVDFIKDCDLLHIQFETGIYQPEWITELVGFFGKPMVTTLHAAAVWPGFNPAVLGKLITHNPVTSFNTTVIRMGIKFENYKPPDSFKSICSFGLGRNDDSITKEAIRLAVLRTGIPITYDTYYTGTGSVWRSSAELRSCIQRSWCSVLYYPPVGADVCSSAANLAIACQRPLIVSDTNWFKHVSHLPGVYTAKNVGEMSNIIHDLTDTGNTDPVVSEIEERHRICIEERRNMESVVEDHLNLYKSCV